MTRSPGYPRDLTAGERADLERVDRHSARARWGAAAALGYGIRLFEHDGLSYAVSRELEGPAFNSVHGLGRRSDLVSAVLAQYRADQATAWLQWPASQAPPCPGVAPEFRLAVHLARPRHAPSDGGDLRVPGLILREIAADEAEAWADAPEEGPPTSVAAEAWRRTTRLVAETTGHHLFLAELDGRPVGAGLLVQVGSAGLVRAGAVHPDARRRGIQRALIGARLALAARLGCTVVVAHAEPELTSSRNLVALGFRVVDQLDVYRCPPW